jgi:hypothetical protein
LEIEILSLNSYSWCQEWTSGSSSLYIHELEQFLPSLHHSYS